MSRRIFPSYHDLALWRLRRLWENNARKTPSFGKAEIPPKDGGIVFKFGGQNRETAAKEQVLTAMADSPSPSLSVKPI